MLQRLFITRIFNNGTYWTLSNRGDWVTYFYESKYKDPDLFSDPVASGYYLDLTELNIPTIQINTAREAFNIDHWLNIIRTYDEYYEVYGFATARNYERMLNIYINNIDVFEHFILYFKEKADNLIKSADSNKIWLPNYLSKMQKTKKEFSNENTSREDFFFKTTIKKYYFKNQKIHVTKREYECLNLLSKGKCTKEIGNILGISPRTVGYYFDNLKKRFGYSSRSQLINLLSE